MKKPLKSNLDLDNPQDSVLLLLLVGTTRAVKRAAWFKLARNAGQDVTLGDFCLIE